LPVTNSQFSLPYFGSLPLSNVLIDNVPSALLTAPLVVEGCYAFLEK